MLDLVGKNYSGLSDPYVEVEVLGMKKKTRFQKELTSCVFDEIFYFNFEGNCLLDYLAFIAFIVIIAIVFVVCIKCTVWILFFVMRKIMIL